MGGFAEADFIAGILKPSAGTGAYLLPQARHYQH
jgi:hypothetical protein